MTLSWFFTNKKKSFSPCVDDRIWNVMKCSECTTIEIEMQKTQSRQWVWVLWVQSTKWVHYRVEWWMWSSVSEMERWNMTNVNGGNFSILQQILTTCNTISTEAWTRFWTGVRSKWSQAIHLFVFHNNFFSSTFNSLIECQLFLLLFSLYFGSKLHVGEMHFTLSHLFQFFFQNSYCCNDLISVRRRTYEVIMEEEKRCNFGRMEVMREILAN